MNIWTKKERLLLTEINDDGSANWTTVFDPDTVEKLRKLMLNKF